MHNFLNIVIPVYDEGENIKAVFQEIASRVIVSSRKFIIYDYEEDNTLPVVRSMMEGRGDIYLVRNKYGSGALNAIKTGFESINDGVVLVLMADLSDDYSKIDLMFNKINEGYDIVCGSRYMKGGEQAGGPIVKSFLSRMAGLSLYYLTGIPTHDVTNSFKMYTKRVLNDIRIESSGGFELGFEILAKSFLKGYRITEVPSIWKDRRAGESRFKLWKWLPNYLHWYFYLITNSLTIRKKSKT